MTQHTTKEDAMYAPGDRLVFVWRKPWKGMTPGTVKSVEKTRRHIEVTVEWDDKSTTISAHTFLEDRTIRMSNDKEGLT
ncbi:MAG: hypothetical protein COB41_00270 [Proteobacteria bacterium]|nr:MAG: hypothetical protein COB41_00270 [Pseudomonadota bacterium]